MEKKLAFDSLNENELYEIEGGSTKVASLIAGAVSAACGLGATVASKRSKNELAGCLSAVASVAATVSLFCAVIPAV